MIRLKKPTQGASLVEYGITVGLISVLAIGAVSQLGQETRDTFRQVETTLASNIENASSGATVSASGPAATDAACYDSNNVNTIGQAGWTGCEGMLIVDDAMLAAAGSSSAGGDESFSIVGPDSDVYTFADSANNIFTGQVTTLNNLFQSTSFNGDIGYWDTSNVTSMEDAFRSNASFNQDIGSWDVSNVASFYRAFFLATSFNQDLGAWDVSGVTSAHPQGLQMVFNGSGFDNGGSDSIGNWTFSGDVFSMSSMFWGTPFNRDISGWDVTGVRDLGYMFRDATNFAQDLSGWNVDSATTCTQFALNTNAATVLPNFTSCTP